jgi:signal transduction histidine kinase
MSTMKLLSIRRLFILALLLIIAVAILSTAGSALILTKGTQTAQLRGDAIRTMLANSSHWTDPQWQELMRGKLQQLDMSVVIRNPEGVVTYQSGKYNNLAPATETVMLTNGSQQLGTAFIYECTPTILRTLETLLIGLLALLLTLAIVVSFIALTILKPLAALSQAAHQVSRNDFSFQFPNTRIHEIAEVFQSFTIMSENLGESLRRQAEVEQERRIFISAIAHDLRTPLFSIRGYLEGLATGIANTPEKINKYITGCQTKAATLERLITDLFAYTQLEYLEQAPNQEPIEIGTLITHLIEGLEPQAQSKTISLIANKASRPCIVHADIHLLTRALENLLDNALRYTPAGGTISVRWRNRRDRLVFTITDTGPGIDAADLPNIFTPLYRGDPSRNGQTGGSGLGLSIAQSILRAHGGDLTAANMTSGSGAIFTGSLAYKNTHTRHTPQPQMTLAL